MKKLFTSSLLLCLSLLSIAQYTLTIDDVTFENGIITNYLNSTEKDIIIPDEFNGKGVEEIGIGGFGFMVPEFQYRRYMHPATSINPNLWHDDERSHHGHEHHGRGRARPGDDLAVADPVDNGDQHREQEGDEHRREDTGGIQRLCGLHLCIEELAKHKVEGGRIVNHEPLSQFCSAGRQSMYLEMATGP